jgi:hypothetical protein
MSDDRGVCTRTDHCERMDIAGSCSSTEYIFKLDEAFCMLIENNRKAP